MTDRSVELSTSESKFDIACSGMAQARAQVLAFIEGVSQADSEIRPGADEWSIGEIAHHLLLVEKRHVQGMLEQIEEGQNVQWNVREQIEEGQTEDFDRKLVLTKRLIPLEHTADISKSGKGKAPEGTHPTHGLLLKELTESLRQIRRETRAKLSPYRSHNLDNLWWEHRRFGSMTLYERISLIGYHDLKHLAQMARVLKN